MRVLILPAVVAVAGLMAGCSFTSLTNHLNPHRVDVRQGNYVDQEMVARLKKGMTREQVRFALGTPLVTDIFHSDRWDYVYIFRPGRGDPQQRVLSVFFDGDKLDRVSGDVQSGDAPAAAAASQTERARVIEIPPAANK
ncbi:outer membrane protein assembly factor BamE [Aromatoleum toluvorans]|uniref:Outer membrane protein assembly factor BamE n=1 Tax=Aromatoleum toluvorans TaxID=92002 RepID=A0ABX1PZG2_9RHOO|nr:outer membrane protein assembly factor BamE [Aromatoleum toluvorans]NMG43476.1 outer membrane protein assembly factor BamE [Aromatoleum toluvorans]